MSHSMPDTALPAFLSGRDLDELVAWRRRLHTMPELSGAEVNTAQEVILALRQRRKIQSP